MKLCYVTDRQAFPGTPEAQLRVLLEKIENLGRAAVDWIQIREKDLEGRVLAGLVEEAKRRTARRCRILLNDRLDVAIAAGADGVHLGERSLETAEAKRFCARHRRTGDFLIGVSAHSVEAVKEAEGNGADYAIFGPVFLTPSKLGYGLPQGTRKLREVCESVSLPVLAIGGITAENARECASAGAAGVAAIRFFQDADDVSVVLRSLRRVR
jgi:thiamine-phosphate pyrophosphorylase